MTNPWMKILKVKEDKTTSANDLPIKAYETAYGFKYSKKEMQMICLEFYNFCKSALSVAEVANKLLEAQYFTAHDS